MPLVNAKALVNQRFFVQLSKITWHILTPHTTQLEQCYE